MNIFNKQIEIIDHFLYFSKVFHVRSVTQGDVIRADVKDIPRIFQVRIDILLCITFF